MRTVSGRKILKRRVNKKRIVGIPRGRVPFCWNSRRWLLMGIDPRSCPYLGDGNVNCIHEDCGYFEWRESTGYVKWKLRALGIGEAWDE